jgi:hypothetical protein
MPTEKKARELAHLRQFQQVVHNAPKGEPIVGERPDFTIPTADGLMGIEVTEYVRPHIPNPSLSVDRPLQEQDSLKNRIVARAQEIFDAQGSSRLRVQVLFRPRHPVDKKDVEATAVALALLIASLPHTADDNQRFEPTREFPFPAPVSIIFARIVGHERNATWEVVAAGLVRPLSPDDLLAIIRKKESKLEGYRRDLTKIWLLIVKDYRTRASYAELTEAARLHSYRTTFDRVYLLDVFSGECTALPVEPHHGLPAA